MELIGVGILALLVYLASKGDTSTNAKAAPINPAKLPGATAANATVYRDRIVYRDAPVTQRLAPAVAPTADVSKALAGAAAPYLAQPIGNAVAIGGNAVATGTVDITKVAPPVENVGSGGTSGALSQVFNNPGRDTLGNALTSLGTNIAQIQPNAVAIGQKLFGLRGKSDKEQTAIFGAATVTSIQGALSAIPIPLVGPALSQLVGALAGTYEGKRVVKVAAVAEKQGYDFQKKLISGNVSAAFSGGGQRKERFATLKKAYQAAGFVRTEQGGLVYQAPSTLTADQKLQAANTEALAKTGKLADGSKPTFSASAASAQTAAKDYAADLTDPNSAESMRLRETQLADATASQTYAELDRLNALQQTATAKVESERLAAPPPPENRNPLFGYSSGLVSVSDNHAGSQLGAPPESPRQSSYTAANASNATPEFVAPYNPLFGPRPSLIG